MQRRYTPFFVGALGMVALAWVNAESQEKPTPTSKVIANEGIRSIRPIFEKHCSMCHGPQKKEGQLNLSALDPDIVKGPDAEHWQEVLDRLNAGTMPPKGKSKLSAQELEQVTAWLTTQLKVAADVRRSTGGRTILRRLTRYEYSNTLRDLLGVEGDFAKDLPPEAAAELGFQNNSKVLVMSTLHLEHFQKIAKRALAEAFGAKSKSTSVPVVVNHGKPTIAANTESHIKFNKVPLQGPMLIRVTAWADRTKQGDYPNLRIEVGRYTTRKGKDAPPKGELVAEVGVDASNKAPRAYDFHFQAEDFSLTNRLSNLLSIGNRFDPGTSGLAPAEYPALHVTNVELFAPFYKGWPPESRARILIESKSKSDENAYAREVIEKFMPRAYRRPITTEEVARMVNLFTKLRANSNDFEEAMTDTLSAVLISPGFLLLAEPARDQGSAGKARKLTDYELASRLSYFLWSTMPDDTLFDLAAKGKLQDAEVLRGQVKRMLADPKSDQFAQRFVSQWLDLDSLGRVAVNPEYFPDFNDELKPAMRQETIRFFDTILREDLSCFTLLDSDFAMLNAGLAKHYGIAGVAGDRFRKVALKPEDHRSGILTHASILLGNSSGDDTHPVKRGVWVLERLLNDPPPPPPPEVPTLAQSDKVGVRLTLKEKLFVHRQEAACMNCHKKIDPWGLAFENYNGIGVWQPTGKTPPMRVVKSDPSDGKKKAPAKDAKKKAGKSSGTIPDREVDSNTELPDGTAIEGIDDLRQYLLKNKRDRFAETVVNKILSYAIWRNLEFSDRQAVHELSQSFRKSDYRIRSLITEIVLSETFRTK